MDIKGRKSRTRTVATRKGRIAAGDLVQLVEGEPEASRDIPLVLGFCRFQLSGAALRPGHRFPLQH